MCLSLIYGCATKPIGQLTKIETDPNEVIVLGQLHIKDKGKNITTETTLFFNEITWGTYAYRADSTGYIYTKLKPGKNNIAQIAYNNQLLNLPDDFATVQLNDATKVYYIGDITMDVTDKLHTAASGLLGLTGFIIDATSTKKSVPIKVGSLPIPAIDFFNKLFPNKKEFVTSLLTIESDSIIVLKNLEDKIHKIAPNANEKIPFSSDTSLIVGSLPETTTLDAITEISRSDEEGNYKISGDISIIGNENILFSASILKIGPNLIIPIFSKTIRLGSIVVGDFEGRFDDKGKTAGKMHIATPIETTLNVDSFEHILSGPKGCTLKRTAGKGLLLIDGNAFLLRSNDK
jgi:hypothetical protein